MRTYILAWFPMVAIAIANGALREAGYKDRLGDLRAHQLSTASGISLLGLYIWGVSRRWKFTSSRQAGAAGSLWVAMTMAFEFLFGHYVMKNPWTKLVEDYNLLKGRLWPLVLAWVGIAPYFFYRLGGRSRD